MNKNYGALLNVLDSWNEKLNHGIPMAPELLADLFGHEINNTMVDEFIDAYDIPGTFIGVSVGAWMNERILFKLYLFTKLKHIHLQKIVLRCLLWVTNLHLSNIAKKRGYR